MTDKLLQEEREENRKKILEEMKFPYFDIRKIMSQKNKITGMSLDSLSIWRSISRAHLEYELGEIEEEEYLDKISRVSNYQTYQIEDGRERIKKGLEGFKGQEKIDVARGLIRLLRRDDSKIDNESLGMYNSLIAEYNSLPIDEKKDPKTSIEYARKCSTVIKGELKYLDHFLRIFQMGPHTPRRRDIIETLRRYISK